MNGHHVISSLCLLPLFPLVPAEQHYKNQNHSQHNQPSNNCYDCNARLYSIGSWLYIRCTVSGEFCIYNGKLNNGVRITLHFTPNQSDALFVHLTKDEKINHMSGHYFRPTSLQSTPSQHCQTLKMSNFTCIMKLLGFCAQHACKSARISPHPSYIGSYIYIYIYTRK